jgi:hypothetical protein
MLVMIIQNRSSERSIRAQWVFSSIYKLDSYTNFKFLEGTKAMVVCTRKNGLAYLQYGYGIVSPFNYFMSYKFHDKSLTFVHFPYMSIDSESHCKR